MLTTLLAACSNDALLPTSPRAAPVLAALTSTGTLATGTTTLVSGMDASLCADVAGQRTSPGTPVTIWSCWGGTNQNFTFESTGEVKVYGTMCLDIWGAQGNNGDAVVIWTCHGGANQKWTRTAAGEIVGMNGKCLDVLGANRTRGTRLVVWTCHGGPNQKWAAAGLADAQPTPPAAPPAAAPDPSTIGVAELPRAYVDTRMPTVTGRSTFVAAGGNLQAALDAAAPGDEVVLQAGATFTGNYVLRPKAGMTAGQWITVRTSGQLPAEGTRVSPADAGQMPKVLTPNAAPALAAAAGAQGWRLVGLEVGIGAGLGWAYQIVSLGSGGGDQTTLAQVPSRLVLDRSYVHGTTTSDVRRCISLNSANTAIIDSYITECHSRDGDSQAIVGWNGPGPFKIVNNRLEGAHENIAFGGGDPSIPGLIPSDIEIRRNYVVKPMRWRGVWTAKNLVEFKAGQRILLEGNVFENNWPDGQVGWAFVWWSANADGNALWSVTQDVTFRYNRVRSVHQGFNMADRYNASLPRMQRVTIAHNVVTGPDSTGQRMYQISGAIEGLTIANNTAIGGEHNLVFASPGVQLPSLVFRDNIAGGEYTFYASGIGMGASALPGMGVAAGNVTGNVFATGSPVMVPAGNSLALSRAAIGFVDYSRGDLRLGTASSFLTSGTGGRTPGADVDRVNQLTQGVGF